MIRSALVAWLCFVLAPASQSQNCGIEYQARILAHTQHFPEDATVGFAAWGILPNVMKTNPLRTFSLAGVLVKSNERWVELMAGLRVDTKGAMEPALDVRVLEQSLDWIELFAEVEYNFTTRQWYFSPIMTTTLPTQNLHLKVGGEFDFFVLPGQSTVFYGPRVSVYVPWAEGIIRNLSFTTAYKFQTKGKPIFRQYLLYNF